jgi:hypothetical protein
VTTLLTTGGPEVQAGAQAALSGPASHLRTYLDVGQYKAQQQDIDTAIHAAEVHGYVAQAAGIAATARANAALAQEAAARARNAADEAAQAASYARSQADQAKIYADQARQSADQAQQSANQATQSANQVGASAQNAQQAATAATRSATQARVSASRASAAAQSAQTYAEQARASAVAAGRDADEAARAASEAQQIAAAKQREEDESRIADDGGNGSSVLTPDEAQALLAAGGQAALDEYRRAQEATSASVIDWIIENGGQILVDLFIGGIKACINDPGFVNCLMGAVDVASLGVAFVKAFDVGKALWRVVSGIGKFFEDGAAARKIIERGRDIINRARGEARVKPVCNCFPAGTLVSMPDGDKRIEDVRVGDRVWAHDLANDRTETRTVVGLFSKYADRLRTIKTGRATIEVTPQHPFWVVGRGWTEAGRLRAGDLLASMHGAAQSITAIEDSPADTTVYNFEVEGDHNYYITDGQLLVHNCEVSGSAAAG